MKTVRNIALFLCFCLPLVPFAQTQSFTGTGGIIPDNQTPIDFDLVVSGLTPSTLQTTGWGLESVCITLTHTWDSDLDISLVAPDGTVVGLSSGNGGSDDNYSGTCFHDSASTPINAGTAPFSGIFRPQGWLGNVNNGQDGNGMWKLRIVDTYPADQGNVISWSLTFGPNPSDHIFNFMDSNLPLVFIDAGGFAIPDDPKILVRMGIVDNGPGVRNGRNDPRNAYDGYAMMETRGRSSQGFAKKSYGFETSDSLGNELPTSLLGMPTESDWIWYGPYPDKSLFRNVMAMHVANGSGMYASRTKFVELFLDGDYKGVYVLMEKIKRDGDRVDIAKCDSDDVAGDSLTGGYIWLVNHDNSQGWASNYAVATNPSEFLQYNYVYPRFDRIMPQQESYLQAYVDSFETAVSAFNFTYPGTSKRYDQFADLESFARIWLLYEFSKNVDAFRLSSFFYKDKASKGGKIHAGPAWDFDLAFHNANYCDSEYPWGWMYDEHCDDHNPFFWGRMRQDPTFKNVIACTWDSLRHSVLDTAQLFHFIDSTASLLQESQVRNFDRWPLLGTYTWPNPNPIPADYPGEVSALKDWILQRLDWMDANMPGICTTPVSSQEALSPRLGLVVYPQPASGSFQARVDVPVQGEYTLKLTDVSGKTAWEGGGRWEAGGQEIQVDGRNLGGGIYLLKLEGEGGVATRRVVIQP